MTRKSSSRVTRDKLKREHAEHLQNNTCWDDINEVSNDAVVLLAKHNAVAGFLRNKPLSKFLPDVGNVSANAKLLTKDITQMRQDLEALQKLHAGKTGGDQDPDQLMHSIAIFEQYNLWMERHEAVVMPTVNAILEQYSVAEARFAAAVAEGYKDLEELAGPTDAQFEQVDNAQPAALRGTDSPVAHADDTTYGRGQTPTCTQFDELPVQEVAQ